VLTDTEVDLFARAHGAPAIVGGWPPEGRRPSSRPGSASRKPSVVESRPGSAASADGRRRTIVGSPLATVDEAKKLKRRQTTIYGRNSALGTQRRGVLACRCAEQPRLGK